VFRGLRHEIDRIDRFKVESALQQAGKTSNAAIGSLNTILPVIQESIEECRRIQMDLRPSMLDNLGLMLFFHGSAKDLRPSIQGLGSSRRLISEKVR